MKKFYVIVIILPIILGVYFTLRNFSINHIKCESQYGPCNEKISNSLLEVEGVNFFSAKKKIINIFEDLFSIEDYDIQYSFPDILKITLVERKPEYSLYYKDYNMVALVDGGGNVLGYQTSSSLPTLKLNGNRINIGETVSEEILFSLEILKNMNIYHGINEGEIVEDGSKIHLNEGVDVIFPLSGDSEVLLGSLNVILSRLNSEEFELKIVKEIDLRYKNPILRLYE